MQTYIFFFEFAVKVVNKMMVQNTDNHNPLLC